MQIGYSTIDQNGTQEQNHLKLSPFNFKNTLNHLKHFLPAQAPLKDFVHHNTLHGFQNYKFHEGLRQASEIFGYSVYLSLDEFRALYNAGKIHHGVLEKIIIDTKGQKGLQEWKEKLLTQNYDQIQSQRVGVLRSYWKKIYKLDVDNHTHPLLFRILSSYLDQGISIWNFPILDKGFLASLREMEQKSYSSFFKTDRARKLLLNKQWDVEELLKIIVGNEKLYEHYLFDQQFAHPGWSGIVTTIESQPETLLDTKKISLDDLIIFELLLEIDAIDFQLGNQWEPLASKIPSFPEDLFKETPPTELNEVISLWQEIYEWNYYDEVLAGIRSVKVENEKVNTGKSFQSLFCIDDRETSLRDYLEQLDPACETFATPGFFGVEFYFQPQNGKFNTKQCPAPVNPGYLIKEIAKDKKKKGQRDAHFTKHSHSLLGGWLISQTIGFWSVLRLFLNIFRPSITQAATFSFNHMDKDAELTFENKNSQDKEKGLQVGFTIEEMTERVAAQLKSIGLVRDFAPIVYAIGHGSSSVNNPYYAAYDCGACSGRPGSVNARVFAKMANHSKVRMELAQKGIHIPEETQFIGGLHDTCRDEILFYDEHLLSGKNIESHSANKKVFKSALLKNAKERSRRFESINTKLPLKKIKEKIKNRSISIFETRPELNHATNTLCIVGKRELTKKLFLDRRAFLNSYDYRIDPEGHSLLTILKAAAPVCGGINLEYYFSKVDNLKLGAGTKLPQNVMGLFGVANGTDGDLRTGLPIQMVEIHDPIRLLMIVEHLPEVVLKTIQQSQPTYEWFINEWVHLVVVHPETKDFYVFKQGTFVPYHTVREGVDKVQYIEPMIETSLENIPVYVIYHNL